MVIARKLKFDRLHLNLFQVSCDEPYIEPKAEEQQAEELKAEELKAKKEPSDRELLAHQDDIKVRLQNNGKLLNKREKMNPSKVVVGIHHVILTDPDQMKDFVLETAEDEIEEIPALPGLPAVAHREKAGGWQQQSIGDLVMLKTNL